MMIALLPLYTLGHWISGFCHVLLSICIVFLLAPVPSVPVLQYILLFHAYISTSAFQSGLVPVPLYVLQLYVFFLNMHADICLHFKDILLCILGTSINSSASGRRPRLDPTLLARLVVRTSE